MKGGDDASEGDRSDGGKQHTCLKRMGPSPAYRPPTPCVDMTWRIPPATPLGNVGSLTDLIRMASRGHRKRSAMNSAMAEEAR